MVKLTRSLIVVVTIVCAVGPLMLISPALFTDTEQKPPTNSIFGRGLYNSGSVIDAGQKADPSYIINLPEDHFEHTNFDIEWWYLTANLEDDVGNIYGVQWTLFRFKNPVAQLLNQHPSSGIVPNTANTWSNQQVFMAHGSVHSMQNHWFGEKFARGGVGNAGVKLAPFSLFIDDWLWQSKNASQDLLPALLTFNVPLNGTKTINDNKRIGAVSVQLTLDQSGPYVLHGENGYSIKSGNRKHASHYYSAPFIKVSGELLFGDKNSTLGANPVKVSGHAWFDQEWTSQLLDTQTTGWDWMSLHLSDGSKLMAFRMRLNGQDDYITGSLINAQGELSTLLPSDITLTPTEFKTVNKRQLPLTWHLTIPSSNIDVTVKTLKDEQWNPAFVSYYEGMVDINGTHTGTGFLELTGY